ncbi:MAG: phosphoribosyltransferase [Candidatus Melainabacteria bacterium]|nr:MAG: phosphoribosyltransferase [Candidatus Melainabacteria bacterium]
MANNETVMQMLAEIGKIIRNTHVVYSSGRHGSTFINKDALYVHVQTISKLCKLMAADYDADQIDVVIGPTMGGAVLAQWMAFHLNARRSAGETLPAFAEKLGEGENKRFIIKRGYDSVIPGKTVVVVDDLLTTGASSSKVIQGVRKLQGKVIGLSVICNRGSVEPQNVGGVPIHALTNVTLDSWSEEECPLCRDGVPINTNFGRGKAFFEERGVAVLSGRKRIRKEKAPTD